MMRALGAVGFHQTYTYFTWRTAKWELEDYLARGVPRDRPPDAAQLLRQHARHPHEYLQYGGPAAFKIRAVLAATGSPSWGVYAGYELYEHVAVRPGQRGVPRLREVPDPRPRLGRRRGRGPHPGAVPRPAQRDPPAAPGPAAAAQRDVHATDDENVLVLQQADRRLDDGARRRDRGGQPRPARRPRDDGAPRPCRPSAWAGTTASPSTTRSAGRTGTGASTTTCGSTPARAGPPADRAEDA